MTERRTTLLMGCLFVLGASGWFLLSTVLADEVADGILIVAGALGALLFTVVGGVPRREEIASLGASRAIGAAAAGVLLIVVAPGLVLANRLTDAPPGTEVLFFTTAAWGVLGVVLALFVRRERPSVAQAVFALVGIAGVAGLLASLERPSSFSPFVRYPDQEVAFLVAGLAWVAGSLLLSAGTRRPERRAVLVVAAAAGVVAAVTLAGVTWVPDGRPVAGAAGTTLLLAVAFALQFAAWAKLVARAGEARPSGLWFLPAAAVAGIGAIEQLVGPRGPDPVDWPAALAGIGLAAVGAAGVWLAVNEGVEARTTDSVDAVADGTTPDERPRIAAALAWPGLALAAAAVLTGAVSLAQPAFSASVEGTRSSGEIYRAAWDMTGAESAAGWLPVLAGALLLVAAVDAIQKRPPSRVAGLAAAAGLIAAAYPLLAETPLRTWTRWVPVEIQQEYGTEYARLAFEVVNDPLRIVSLAIGAAAAVVLVAGALVAVSTRPVSNSITDARL